MFGYVRPFKGELLVKEYDAYKGVYCQVCKALGMYYGPLARLTLTYDCTFYALLALNQRESHVQAKKKRCTCNPLKKCTYVCPANGDRYAEECFKKAAALCVIMTSHKLRDTVEDEGGIKGFAARILHLLSCRACKKASQDFPFMAEAAQKMMDAQRTAERAEKISLDACSAPTAELLETLCAEIGESASEKAVLRQLGYFFGRWVYIMDAADDLCDDLKANKFNPFIEKLELSAYIGSELPEEKRNSVDIECNSILNATIARLLPALNFLFDGQFSGIIANILQKGLPEMQREILFLHVKEKSRKGRNRSDSI